MPLTSIAKDAAKLTLTVVGDYPVSQERLWNAFADPRQLERFWGLTDRRGYRTVEIPVSMSWSLPHLSVRYGKLRSAPAFRLH